MCGIFGFSVLPGKVMDENLLAFLVSANEDRGNHAWGWWSPTARIVKGLGPATAAPWEALLSERTAFGHTRFATSGGQGRRQAHPWHLGRIIGAHNGQVYNAGDLRAKYGYPGTVDSQALLAHLSAGRPMFEAEGYGALEWVEAGKEGKGVCLSRLSASGELWVARVEGLGVVWTSSKAHGVAALEWAEIPLSRCTAYTIDVGATYRAVDGALWALPTRASTRVAETVWGGGWRDGYGSRASVDLGGWMDADGRDMGPNAAEDECPLCGAWTVSQSRLGLCSKCARHAVG
jgi:hypothetical protein